jgi:Flp pilus assembly protein TadD
LDPKGETSGHIGLANRAEARLELGDSWGAVADAGYLLQTRPNDASLLQIRGKAHLELGNYEWAFPDFSRAVEIEPDAIVFTLRAQSREGLGDTKGAEQDRRTAASLNSRCKRPRNCVIDGAQADGKLSEGPPVHASAPLGEPRGCAERAESRIR